MGREGLFKPQSHKTSSPQLCFPGNEVSLEFTLLGVKEPVTPLLKGALSYGNQKDFVYRCCHFRHLEITPFQSQSGKY